MLPFENVSPVFWCKHQMHMKTLATAREGARESGDEAGAKAPVASGLVESLRTIPYSNRLKRSIKKVAKAHTKVDRVRQDAAFKNARKSERRFSRIAVEEHGLLFMQRNRRLAKASSDVAIGKQKHALRSAMGSGRYFEASNRRPEGGNSQTCLCGESTPKTLKDRVHACPACGLTGPRDQISAIICQHTTFGSIPKVKENSVPGLGTLEQAVRRLETRRGEIKGRCGESHTTESISAVVTAQTSELSVKRPAQRRRKAGNTTGETKVASVEAKTRGYASAVGSCPLEAKDPVQIKRFPILKKVVSLTEKRPPSGG